MDAGGWVTVTGGKHYLGMAVFTPGQVLWCRKEPQNSHDAEAVWVGRSPSCQVGYLANSPYTVARGTLSAGRIYDQVPAAFRIRVCFVAGNQVICRLCLPGGRVVASAPPKRYTGEKPLRSERRPVKGIL